MRTCEIVPGCPAVVPSTMFGCKRHWFMVPEPIRQEVWRTWQARLRGDPAEPHLAAKKKAQEAVARVLPGRLF
jgi:hypothetical protein